VTAANQPASPKFSSPKQAPPSTASAFVPVSSGNGPCPSSFDLNLALAVRQGRDGRDTPLYRPYRFASRFSSFIARRHLKDPPQLSFVDNQGVRWQRVDPTEVD
jgi:hypothetical protein